MTPITVSADDLAKIVNERNELRARVQELLAENTKLVEANRALDIDDRVREFMRVCTPHAPRPMTPGVPDEAIVRHRMRLVGEEFCELMEAVFPMPGGPGGQRAHLRDYIGGMVDTAYVRVDMPELADACADLDYVVAGARVAFGIDGRPIARAVHAANMEKAHGPMRESDGKRLKPPGWRPPDIAGELRKQGWNDPSVSSVAHAHEQKGCSCSFCGIGQAAIHEGNVVDAAGRFFCSKTCQQKWCARDTDGKHKRPNDGGRDACEECGA